jgi:hypothetical protein
MMKGANLHELGEGKLREGKKLPVVKNALSGFTVFSASESARGSVLEKGLTPPTLSEARFFANDLFDLPSFPLLPLTGYRGTRGKCYT